MKIEIKEIYKCDHCKKLYQIKNAAIKHEKSCSKNPENNRPCFNCSYLEKSKTVVYSNYYGEEWERSVDLLFCASKKIFLFPPKVEIKGNQYETDEPNEPMPKQCDVYDNGGNIELNWLVI